MKNKLNALLMATLLLTGITAHASSSFWSGFGVGATTGFMGSNIAYACHRPRYVVHEYPRPVEVRTVHHYTPVNSTSLLRQELNSAEQEIDALEAKNSRLENQLQQERIFNRKEQRNQQREIDSLQDTISGLESSISMLEKKINKLSKKSVAAKAA